MAQFFTTQTQSSLLCEKGLLQQACARHAWALHVCCMSLTHWTFVNVWRSITSLHSKCQRSQYLTDNKSWLCIMKLKENSTNKEDTEDAFKLLWRIKRSEEQKRTGRPRTFPKCDEFVLWHTDCNIKWLIRICVVFPLSHSRFLMIKHVCSYRFWCFVPERKKTAYWGNIFLHTSAHKDSAAVTPSLI